ncbi:MAG: hypothetical protein AB1938_01130 [Myxococcota bacterium]
MYAPRHLVFAGPGKLPEELRRVVAKRTGTPQSDLPNPAPRLLGIFENASEAERVAAGLQRMKIGAMVAGPEQPPVEKAWALASSLDLFADRWRAMTPEGVVTPLDPAQLAAITIVDWRPADRAADRAVLLRFRDGSRPVLLRASAIDTVSPQALPGKALHTIGQFLDACATTMPPDTRVRQRRLSPEDLEEATLGIDLLPLAVAMVELLDETPYPLSQPLAGGAALRRALPPPHEVPAWAPPLAGLVAWSLYAASLALGPVCLLLLMVGGMTASFIAVVCGVLAGAVGSRRLSWAQWLGHQRWGELSRIPRWPRHKVDGKSAPDYRDLVLDASLLAFTIFGAVQGSIVEAVLIAPMAAIFVLSTAAVWLHYLLLAE